MDRLLPSDDTVDDAELERLYTYPEPLDRPWVKVNFISSLDGAVSVEGRSRGLSDRNDRRILRLGRELADVVLVGAGTAHIEGYAGVTSTEVSVRRRIRLGRSRVPPIAVVSRRASIAPTSPLLTRTEVAPIVFTTSAAPQARRDTLSEAGADVAVVGTEDVDLTALLAELDRRQLRRVCCEGGPHLFGALIAAGLVDELCLSIAPLLAGGDAGRIAAGPLPAAPLRMRLASVLHADDLLMVRYLRR